VVCTPFGFVIAGELLCIGIVVGEYEHPYVINAKHTYFPLLRSTNIVWHKKIILSRKEACGSVVVKALCYKPEGGGFKT
jgi:hypothetical protein